MNEALAPAYNFSEIEQITRFHELNKNFKIGKLSIKINKLKYNVNVKKYAEAHRQIQTYWSQHGALFIAAASVI